MPNIKQTLSTKPTSIVNAPRTMQRRNCGHILHKHDHDITIARHADLLLKFPMKQHAWLLEYHGGALDPECGGSGTIYPL